MTMHFSHQVASKSPIFFLHSSASNGNQWNAYIEAFERERKVFAPNLPGYGPVAGRMNPTLTGMAALAAPIIDQIELQGEPVHLVGHSFGGAVALHIAINRSDLIKSLAVYEPASFHILQSGSTQQRQAHADIENLADALASSIETDSAQTGMKRFIDFWNAAGCWDSFSDSKRGLMVSLARTVLSNFDDGKIETWTLANLNQLQLPVLVMEGCRSPSVSRQVSEIIASAIPGAMYASFGELGHMAPAFCPEKTLPAIRDNISIAETMAMDQVWPLQSAA